MLSTRSSLLLRGPAQALRVPIARYYSDDQSFEGGRPQREKRAYQPGTPHGGGYKTREPSGQGYADNFARKQNDRPQSGMFSGGGSKPSYSRSPRPDFNSSSPRPPPRPRTPRPSGPPPHLLTLADLNPAQISRILQRALVLKHLASHTAPYAPGQTVYQSLNNKTVAMLFSKRSTRTRVASETGAVTLGGHPMFLGKEDIQLGVNESLRDSAKVIGSMVDGIMARVGAHSEVEGLVEHSGIPVINALSDLYHPTQILADLMTLIELYSPVSPTSLLTAAFADLGPRDVQQASRNVLGKDKIDLLACLKGKKIAWVGDTNNVLNDMLVSMPRLGMTVAVASPKGYDAVDERVWKRVEDGGSASLVHLTNSPSEALSNTDLVVTDTWISMGQEAEKATRLAAFEGYQITNAMVESAGAKPDWKFLHCLPRKSEEVDDEVFYGDRSVVFQEAENRKWTIMACFDMYIGKWNV